MITIIIIIIIIIMIIIMLIIILIIMMLGYECKGAHIPETARANRGNHSSRQAPAQKKTSRSFASYGRSLHFDFPVSLPGVLPTWPSGSAEIDSLLFWVYRLRGLSTHLPSLDVEYMCIRCTRSDHIARSVSRRFRLACTSTIVKLSTVASKQAKEASKSI